MKLVALDWLVLGVYGALMLAIGFYFSRRASRSVTDYFLSGRSLPWWIAGTSMVATTFSADTPLLVSSIVRREGVAGNWIWINFAISHALTTFFLAALWRRARVVTDVELCELRYAGRPGRMLRALKGAFYAFVTNSVVLGWVLLAMATIAQEVLGLPKLTTLAVSVAVTLTYATVSGMWGVAATDFIQFIVAMIGSIILAVSAVRHVGGLAGLAELLPNLTAADGRPAMEIVPVLGQGALGGFLVALTVQWWSWKYSDGGGVLIQRMSASRDERHSTLSMLWFTFANNVIRPWPWFLVALVSLAVFPDLTDHKSAYPMMMTRFLGPGLLGLMMAGILAAFMSTVDTHINLAASYFVNDIYRRFLRPRASERHHVMIGRLASVAFILIGALIALFNTSIVKLFEFLLQLIAGAGVVFLLRWFWWRINAWSEIVAMLASLLTATLLNLSNRHDWIGHEFATWEIMLINVGLSGALWLAATFLTPPTDERHLLAFYRRVRPGGLWGPIARMAAQEDRRTREAAGGQEAPRAEEGAGTADPPDLPSAWRPRRPLECFLLTLVLVYGGLIGVGHLLYSRFASGGLLCAAAILAAVRIARNLRREPAGATGGALDGARPAR